MFTSFSTALSALAAHSTAVDVVGKIGMGAQRWLVIGPLQIQPSEIAKVALIMVLARYYHGLRR